MAHPFAVQAATRAATAGESISGTRVVTEAEVLANSVFTFTITAAANLDLPAPTDALAGQMLLIHNAAAGAFILTIRNGPGGSTVCTPAQNENAIVWCTGTIWRGGQMVGS